MAVHWETNLDAARVAVVKNTFIAFEYPSGNAQVRRKSVPASSRLCQEDLDAKVCVFSMDEDASTDAQTEASTWAESGLKTPCSSDDYAFDEAAGESSQDSQSSPEEAWISNGWCAPCSPMMQMAPFVEPSPIGTNQSLRSKASPFRPQGSTQEAPKRSHKYRIAEVIEWAKAAMQNCKHVACVDVSDGPSGWSFVIQPQGMAGDDCQTAQLIQVAKEALLEAAAQSKNVYLMGFRGQKPFVSQPQGFEATFGAMENPSSACWHVFKKGFCQHGANCCKDHPACEMPVRILVESVKLQPCTQLARVFKQEIADLVMVMIATLGACTYADKVEAFQDKGCHGWTVEIMPKEELQSQKESILSLAQSVLFSATDNSSSLHIMSYATQPFLSKSKGFVTMIGDMQDETQACSDFYSKGACTNDCACRWEHPTSLMPINIVIKERSTLKCSTAMLEYLASKGLVTVART